MEVYAFKIRARAMLNALRGVDIVFALSPCTGSFTVRDSEGLVLLQDLRRLLPWSLRSLRERISWLRWSLHVSCLGQDAPAGA